MTLDELKQKLEGLSVPGSTEVLLAWDPYAWAARRVGPVLFNRSPTSNTLQENSSCGMRVKKGPNLARHESSFDPRGKHGKVARV